jgi:hypothetical protein
MSHLPRLEVLDKDGAIREMAGRTSGPTRRGFLMKGTAGGVAAAAALGGLGTFALAQSGAASADALEDLEILNFALVLEFLEGRFYEEAVERGDFGGEVGTYAQTLRDHELEHIDALTAAIQEGGGTPVAEPEFDFMDTTADEATFLETSVTLEETGVGAYLGAAPSIESTELLMAAGSILVVEALHTSWGRTLVDGNELPAPTAFVEPLTVQQVLDAVGGTGFITSELPAAITGAASSVPSTAG